MSDNEPIFEKFEDTVKSKYSEWQIRLVLAFIITLFAVLLLSPSYVTELKVNEETKQCELQLKYWRVLVMSLVGSVGSYFLLKNYY